MIAAADTATPAVGRLWLLAALAAVALPHWLRQPAWLVLLGLGCFGWRLGVERRGWSLPRRWLRLLLTVAAIGAVLAAYRTLFGRDAGLALLTVMLCLKLLELRTRRDGLVVLVLGYFLVAGGFLHDQGLLSGAYLFAMVLLLTAALIALHHPAASLGHSRAYLHLAGSLLVQALPLLVVLFLLFPRLPGPLWGLPKDAFAGRTGLSDEMTLGAIGLLAESDEVAFRVVFHGATPPPHQLYWRGPVLWRTDGRRWEPLQRDDRPLAPWYGGALRHEARGPAYDYTLTLEPHNRRWLLALDLPALLPPQVQATADFQLWLPQPATTLQRFSLRAHTDYATGSAAPWERRAGLQLPAAANPRTRAYAARWQGLPPGRVVEEALRLFREEPFYYSRQPPLLDADPVDGFLFDTRRGFCEHYAAAFVTLMRAAGLPARVVTGYQGGERNELGEYLLVRQADAHAWAEVLFEEEGWVRVDPTAVIPPQRIEALADSTRFRSLAPDLPRLGALGAAWLQLRQGWDAVHHAWNTWVLGYDQARQRALLERLGLGAWGWRGMIALLGVLAALAVAIVATYLLLRERGRPDPLQRLYRRFCQRLARIGLARAAHEGPLAYAARIAATRPDLAPAVDRITALYVQLRYGPPREDSLPALRQAVQAFRPARR